MSPLRQVRMPRLSSDVGAVAGLFPHHLVDQGFQLVERLQAGIHAGKRVHGRLGKGLGHRRSLLENQPAIKALSLISREQKCSKIGRLARPDVFLAVKNTMRRPAMNIAERLRVCRPLRPGDRVRWTATT